MFGHNKLPRRITPAVVFALGCLSVSTACSRSQSEPTTKQCYMFEVGKLSHDIRPAGLELLTSYLGIKNLDGYTGLQQTSVDIALKLSAQRKAASSKSYTIQGTDIVSICVSNNPENINGGGTITQGPLTQFVDNPDLTPERFKVKKEGVVFVIPPLPDKTYGVSDVPAETMLYPGGKN